MDPLDPKKFDPDTVIAFSKSITSGDTKYRQYASGLFSLFLMHYNRIVSISETYISMICRENTGESV